MSKNKKKGGGAPAPQQTQPLSQAEKLKNLGNEAFTNKHFEKAKNLYSQAIQLEKNPVFYSNRAAASFELDEFEDSIRDTELALEIDKEFWKAYLRRGLSQKEMDNFDDAIESLEKALEIAKAKAADEKSLDHIQNHLTTIRKERDQEYQLPKDDPEAIRTRRLLEWLHEGGSKFPKLKIKHYDKDYRGVHATQNIKTKDQIVFIPLSHLITLEMAKATGTGKKVADSGLDLLSPKHSFLSTFLLRERKVADSFWRPYLDMLPADYNSFPVFFSDEEMKWLEGSPFADQVRDKKNDLKKDYDAICGVAPEFAEYSFHDFCWARMTASSRIFGIVINGEKTDAFVPVADMLNHRRPKQTSWLYSDEKKGFIIESLEDIKRGEQVCDSYGRKCNSRFFLNYGFINMDNDANEVALRVSFDPEDETLAMKERMMGEQASSKTFRVLASVEEENTIEFMNFVRFTQIDDKNTLLGLMNSYENAKKSEKNDDGYKPQKTPSLSVEIEMSTLKVIKEICERQLARYPESLEHDRELMKKSGDLTWNQRNCTLLRSGEKEILHFLLDLVDKCLPLLSMSFQDANKLIMGYVYAPYSEYIKRIVMTLLAKKQMK